MILVNMCLCITVQETNVKLYGVMFYAVLKLVRKVKMHGSMKFSACTYRDFVLMAPRGPCSRTVCHDGK
jgi:hypothetical protein